MYRIVIISCFILLSSCESQPRFSEFSDNQLVDILYDVSLSNTIAENHPEEMRDSIRAAQNIQIAEIHDLEIDMLDSIIDYVHMDNIRFVIITDSLDKKLKESIKLYK